MKNYQHISQGFNLSWLIKLHISVVLVICSLTISGQQSQPDIKQLVVGQKTERKSIGTEIHAYAVELKSGQVLRVNIQEKGADILAYISRIENQQEVIVSGPSNSGSGFMQESLTAIADQNGVYGLVIRAVQTDADIDAGYDFTATLSDSATYNDSQRIQAEKTLGEAALILGTNDTGQMSAAISNLEKSVSIWQKIGDKYWEAITQMWIGSISGKIGDLSKSETNLNQALNLLDKTKYKAEAGNIYLLLGEITKNEEKARIFRNEALTIFRAIGDKRLEKAYSGANSGFRDLQVNEQGDIRITNYENDLKAARAKNNSSAELAVWTKTVLAFALGDEIEENSNQRTKSIEEIMAAAQNLQKKKLDLYKKVESEGLPLAEKINDKNAEMQMLIALGIGYSDIESDDRNQTDNFDGEEESNPNVEKAKNYLIRGLALSRNLNDKLFECLGYAGLSMIYYDDDESKLSIFFGKKFINSIHNYRQTFNNLADRESQQYVGRQTERLYEFLANMLIEDNRLAEAIQVINFGRDQEFFDFKLSGNQLPSKLTLTVRENRNDRDFDSKINQLAVNTNIKSLFIKLETDFDKENSEEDIIKNVEDAEEMKGALDELSKKTGKNHVTVYLIGSDEEEDRYIILVTPKKISVFSSDMDTTNQEILDFLKVLENPTWDPRPIGGKIYVDIFKALEEVGENVSNITLEKALEHSNANVIHWSLTGMMRYIPMAALYDAERGQYLVEQFENVVFTRAKRESFLIPPKRWEKGLGFATTPVIKMADSNMVFSDLPSADDEVFAIFGDRKTTKTGYFTGQIFLDKDFTRDTLFSIQQAKPDFVHIASHFHLEPGDAGKSFLPLSDGSKISLIDLQKSGELFLGVDLLMLSACQTAAQHADAKGKEIDGFAELAQRLGAKSVIATLWKIKDQSTSELMREFYRLKQENPDASKSEILRLAQMSLLNGEESFDKGLKNRLAETARGFGVKVKGKGEATTNDLTTIPFEHSTDAPFAHPHYWAPFVLYGGSNGGKTTKEYNIPKPPARQSTNNVANITSNRNSIAGTWSGKYVCGQGVSGVTLTIEQNGNTVQGLFEFYALPENPTFRSGSGIYRGSFDPNLSVMQMDGERWVNQPDINWIMVGFSGNFDENRQIFSGRMLSSNCGGIELKREATAVLNDNSNFGNNSLPTPQVTLKDIETSFNNKMFDESIRLGNIFLQSTPESKEANSYVGFSYLLKQDSINAANYLEKAIRLGQPLTLPMKRLRIPLLGHAFEDAKVTLLTEGIVIEADDSLFFAKFSDLTDAGLKTYYANLLPQCGIVHLKGMFTEIKKKSEKKKVEKKQFDLFPPSAFLVSKQSGQLVVNEAACNTSEDFVPTTIITLMSRLR